MKRTVYIASPESQQIHVWNLNHEGALTLTQVVDVLGQVWPIAVSPDRCYPCAGVRPEFCVLVYSTTLDDSALIFAAESALPGSPTHIFTDHQGQLVFIGSYNAGNVSITRLEGGLPVGVINVVEEPDGYHSANILPDNHMLWVLALKRDCIRLFTINNDGHFVAQDPAGVTTIEGTDPRHMVFHPNEQYTYYVNELNSLVDVWELEDSHSDTECIQTLDMMPEDFSDTRWAADIHITSDGRHLCACDRATSLITVPGVSEDGNVLSKEGFQPTETQSRGFSIDYSGKCPIAAGQESHHISVYEIAGEQGLLHKRGRYAVGQGPMRVVVNIH